MIGRWTVVNAILVVIILALGVQIARTWMRTLPPTRVEDGSDEADATSRRPGRRSKRDHGSDAATVVAAITEKDLFDPSRRGTAEAEAGATPEPAQPPAPPDVVVVGVRLIGGDAEAVVEETSGKKEQRRIRAGDAVGDYTVDEIRATSVVLTAATGESVTLWLDIGAGSAKAPTNPQQVPRPTTARVAVPATPPSRAAGTATERAALRRAAQRSARRRQRERRARQGNAQLPEGVRQRLEALRRNR